MIRKKVQGIVLGVKDRIELIEEARSIFSSKFILEGLPDSGRSLVGGQPDQPLGVNCLKKVCRSILVAIAISVNIIKVTKRFGFISFFRWQMFYAYDQVPTIKQPQNKLRNVSPGTVVFRTTKFWYRAKLVRGCVTTFGRVGVLICICWSFSFCVQRIGVSGIRAWVSRSFTGLRNHWMR